MKIRIFFLTFYLLIPHCPALSNSSNPTKRLLTNDDPIELHIISHSHMDLGWLNTVDEYFNGQVRAILDSVMNALSQNSKRKFTFSEVGFLKRYLDSKGAEGSKFRNEIIAKMKNFFDSGQLEMTNGGYVANDEATSYFDSIIDQFTYGHLYMKRIFNYFPKTGWQVDSFGHSNSQAALNSQFGFGAVDKYKEMAKVQKKFQIIMTPFQNSGKETSIYTEVFFNFYTNPPNFNYNNCPGLSPNDANSWKGQQFAKQFKDWAKFFRHKIFMQPYGGDFEFGNADCKFSSIENVINYIDKHPELGIKVLMSTPTMYIEALQKKNLNFEKREEDWFPLYENYNEIWTGYFSNRPSMKFFIRDTMKYFHNVRNFFSFLFYNKKEQKKLFLRETQRMANIKSKIDILDETLGLLHHHDGITGTSPQRVIDDYKAKLFYAKNQETSTFNSHCHWNRTSEDCPHVYQRLKDMKPILITFFNPSADVTRIIELRIPQITVEVKDSTNQVLESDIFCPKDTHFADCRLYFKMDLHMSSIQYIKIIPIKKTVDATSFGDKLTDEIGSTLKLISSRVSSFIFSFCKKLITNESECTRHELNLSYNSYSFYIGHYLFQYNVNKPYTEFTKKSTHFIGKNLIVISLHSDQVTALLKIYYKENNFLKQKFCELETYLDSVHIDFFGGKQITVRYESNIDHNQIFYTDSNGLEMQRRKYTQFPLGTATKIAAANYYPLTSTIYIKDDLTVSKTKKKSKYMKVIIDRALGATARDNGAIEIMIQRCLSSYDNKGVREKLYEYENGQPVRVDYKHWILFNTDDGENINNHREVQYLYDLEPTIVYSDTEKNTFNNNIKPLRIDENSFLVDKPVKISFNYIGNNEFLLRMINLDENKGNYVKIPENNVETSLTGNTLKSEVKKYNWKIDNVTPNFKNFVEMIPKNNSQKYFKPMEIRTFLIKKS